MNRNCYQFGFRNLASNKSTFKSFKQSLLTLALFAATQPCSFSGLQYGEPWAANQTLTAFSSCWLPSLTEKICTFSGKVCRISANIRPRRENRLSSPPLPLLKNSSTVRSERRGVWQMYLLVLKIFTGSQQWTDRDIIMQAEQKHEEKKEIGRDKKTVEQKEENTKSKKMGQKKKTEDKTREDRRRTGSYFPSCLSVCW